MPKRYRVTIREIKEWIGDLEAEDLQDAHRQADAIQKAEGDPCDYYEVSAHEIVERK